MNTVSTPPTTPGTIVITVDGQEFTSDALTTPTGQTTVEFTVTGNFVQESLIARFTTDGICSDSEVLNLLSCDDACIAQPDAISGVSYPDYDLNGRRGVGEGAEPGVRVNIYDCDNNLAGTALTGFDGVYAIDGLAAGQDYRVEFIAPGSNLAVATYGNADGTAGNSDVRFVSAGSCNVNIGVINPDFCPLDQVQFVTACFSRLNPAQNPGADAVISFKGAGGQQLQQPAGLRHARSPPREPRYR